MPKRIRKLGRFIRVHRRDLDEAGLVVDYLVSNPDMLMETRVRAQGLAGEVMLVPEDLVGRFAGQMVAMQPWASSLPEEERRTFADQAADALRTGADTGRFDALTTLVEDWRNTAEIWSDPDLAAALAADVEVPLGDQV